MKYSYLTEYNFDITYQGDFFEAKIAQIKLINILKILPIFFNKKFYIIKNDSESKYLFKINNKYKAFTDEEFESIILNDLPIFYSKIDYLLNSRLKNFIFIKNINDNSTILDKNNTKIFSFSSNSFIKQGKYKVEEMKIKKILNKKMKNYTDIISKNIKISEKIFEEENSIFYINSLNSKVFYKKVGNLTSELHFNAFDNFDNKDLNINYIRSDRIKNNLISSKDQINLLKKNEQEDIVSFSLNKYQVDMNKLFNLVSENSQSFINLFNNIPFFINLFNSLIFHYSNSNLAFISPKQTFTEKYVTLNKKTMPVEFFSSKVLIRGSYDDRPLIYDLNVEFAEKSILKIDLVLIDNSIFECNNFNNFFIEHNIKNKILNF